MSVAFSFNYAGVRLYFGEGSVKKLKDHLKPRSSVLVVTSKSAARVSGALDDAKAVFQELNIEYFNYDGVTPNPTTAESQEIAKLAWEKGVDALVAIGGGSVIDAAKVASVVRKNGGTANDYIYYKRSGGSGIPLLAVNLTHGTGTEVDRYAVLTDAEKGQKRGVAILYPEASADDPHYLLSLPKDQTIYTALDAFYHSYEAVTRLGTTPPVELLTKEAISLIKQWLPSAVSDLKNEEARYWLLYASMLAGIAIDMEGTHIIHALEHQLSGANPKVPHGAGLAMLGPRSAYHTHSINPAKSAEVLKILDPTIRPVAEDATKAEKAIADFQAQVGFEQKLSDYGFTKDQLEVMVAALAPHGRTAGGPHMPMSHDQLLDIMMKSARCHEVRGRMRAAKNTQAWGKALRPIRRSLSSFSYSSSPV
ncbi:MAG: iron-containing alcohol dehydrogenase [Candidatus Marsarchaeota archaeon]